MRAYEGNRAITAIGGCPGVRMGPSCKTCPMAKRTAVGFALAFSAVLVLILPGAAPATVGDLTSAEICALFPQNGGFTFVEDLDPIMPSCQAGRGDPSRTGLLTGR